MYHDLLGEFSPELLQAAARHVATTGTFFPSVSELRRAVMELEARARGELSAEEAWATVSCAMARWGSYGEPNEYPEYGYRMPRELDALMLRTIQGLGGWRSLCSSEQPGVERAHFLRIYDGLQRANRGDAYLLPAVRETVNRLADGLRVPRLVAPRDLERN